MLAADSRTRPGSESSSGPALDPSWAWAAYQPDAARPWDRRRAAHLYRRAAFGASWSELENALRDGPERTLDRLLRPGADAAAFHDRFDQFESAAIDPDANSTDTLREWWLRRMLQTPCPLLEKMTLFWHGHFAASRTRIQNGWLVRQHVSLLRSQALGHLPALLQGLMSDPAFLMGAEGAANRKALPNLTFARNVLDLYTLGPGQASERDVKDAARAFSGLFVLRNRPRLLDHEQDTGPKTILGQTGPWKADDVVRIALAHPATARHVVHKVYRWLISETDEPGAESPQAAG